MPGSAGSFDSMDAAPHAAQREWDACKARMRHVLAYISEKRYRRWTTSAAAFLLIYYVSQVPFSFLSSITFDVLAVAGIGPNDVFPTPATLGLVLLATTFLPPLFIALVIFSRLRRIYKGF